MSHQSLRIYQEVFEHLYSLCILKRYMFPLAPSLMELLMHELSEQSPLFSMPHYQEMVASGDEIMCDIWKRAVAVNVRFLVNESFYNATISDYNQGCRTKFERNYGAVFLGPFCESGSVWLANINNPSAWSLCHTGNAPHFLEVDGCSQ